MANNLKEAKELLERYKSITLEQLEEIYDEGSLIKMGDEVLNEITGFGDTTYYYVFISNNKAIEMVKGEKYRLQE